MGFAGTDGRGTFRVYAGYENLMRFDPEWTRIPPNIAQSTKDRSKGTGLGLSISLRIVKDHHGKISVESEPGAYTRFHVDLPVDNHGCGVSPETKRHEADLRNPRKS